MKWFAGVSLLVLASNALAWDGSGHRLVGEIAFRRLQAMQSPAVAKLNDLFTPDIIDLATAATVPDQIKNAAYNKSGFPTDSGRKYNHFHFYDGVVGSSTKKPIQPVPGENALTKLSECVKLVKKEKDLKKRLWLVSWIAHLVGDLHQPLHCAAHYWPDLKTADGFDRGGNLFFLEAVPDSANPYKTAKPKSSRFGPKNLHSYWDGLVSGGDDQGKDKRSLGLIATYPSADFQVAIARPARSWHAESLALAKSVVYPGLVLFKSPSAAYRAKAKAVAERQVTLAGYRLAAVLDRALR